MAGEGERRQVLLHGDRIAGLVRLVAPERGVGKINMVGRIPAYRGRGVGPRLVARALHALVERGATRVTLDVEAANARAVRLYQRFGFTVETRTPVLERTLDAG